MRVIVLLKGKWFDAGIAGGLSIQKHNIQCNPVGLSITYTFRFVLF